ncbi:MAG: hypothetical protein P8Y12_09605 [Gammaproteobacteria bacterium]
MSQNKQTWSISQMVWSALIAVLVWTGFGFSWLGYGVNWVTEGQANQMVKVVVLENFAEICAAQARNAPDAQLALKELAELSSYKQTNFVEESGWATMPGSDSATSGVARLCADKLRQT